MNHSHQSSLLTDTAGDLCFNRTVAFIDAIQRKWAAETEDDDPNFESEKDERIPSIVFLSSNSIMSNMSNPIPASDPTPASAPTPARGAGGGRRAGTANYSKDETMDLLRCIEKILPIGCEEWNMVVQEHGQKYPNSHRDKGAVVRKYSTLHRKTIPTGNPACPEEVRLAKHIKYKIGDKACLGDAEEDFVLEEVGFGESGANPNPDSASGVPTGTIPSVAPTNVSEASAVPAICKRNYNKKSGEGDEARREFMDIYKMNMLQMQEMQKTNLQVMNMIGSSLAAVIPQWNARNNRASVVFRPNQEPVLEGFVPLASTATATANNSQSSSDEEDEEVMRPKRLRSSTRNK